MIPVGVITYIVPSTTIGVTSSAGGRCDMLDMSVTLAWYVQATCRWATLPGVICVNGENRAPPGSRPYTGQSPWWGAAAGAWRLTTSNSISIDLFRNGFAQVLKLYGTAKAKDALDDASLPVEQDGVGQSTIMIDRLHVAAADQDRKRRPKLGDKGTHLGVADIIGNRGDVEVFAVKLAVKLGHVREFGPTGLAPGRPEIHERDLAAV